MILTALVLAASVGGGKPIPKPIEFPKPIYVIAPTITDKDEKYTEDSSRLPANKKSIGKALYIHNGKFVNKKAMPCNKVIEVDSTEI